MTGSTGGDRVPGATLLKIARLLFDDDVIAAVVQPTISDLQREIAQAGSSRLQRLRAQWLGYGAFWRLALVVPFTHWRPSPGNGGTTTFRVVRRLAVGSVLLMLFAAAGPALRAWVAVVIFAGAVCAMLIHAWYERHPSDIPDPTERAWRPPQINFSSTEVAGDIGGLIFVVGSVLIVSLALPPVVWFLLVGTVGGCVVAWVLVAWRASHATWTLPENRIGGSASISGGRPA